MLLAMRGDSRVSYLVWVELDQLAVVCLGEGKQGCGHAAVGSRMRDVPHAKEETHLTHHLITPMGCHHTH